MNIRVRSALSPEALLHRMQQGVDRPHPALWSRSGLAGE
jgi:hypothetical protein